VGSIPTPPTTPKKDALPSAPYGARWRTFCKGSSRFEARALGCAAASASVDRLAAAQNQGVQTAISGERVHVASAFTVKKIR
jgi:hypothetical protein